jgi:hypothetical protein
VDEHHKAGKSGNQQQRNTNEKACHEVCLATPQAKAMRLRKTKRAKGAVDRFTPSKKIA